ncbi:unnamed protein product [Cuscuta campestris]|uniref:Uncharacterized protein n=1 Tax=Cuscuta campestris TaxID=132261 RepID=A0A484MCN4_9ASTE|nr:unnamed protein product [Cuscuta campestris]
MDVMWANWVIKPERVHPEPTPELEDACDKLLKGDPVTGKPYANGGWVYRLRNPDGDVLATHDAEDDRANSPMVMLRAVLLIQSDDEVLPGGRSPITMPPSPPQASQKEGDTTSRCTPLNDLVRDKKVKSPTAIHLSESDRANSPQVEAKTKQIGLSSSRTKSHKRKGSHKTSRGHKKKKTGSLDLEGESVEEAFLALIKRLQKVGVIYEEIGQSLLEPKGQVSELTLLLDSTKLEFNDRAEREKRLEEELMGERARLEEERARFALLEEEGKRKVTEVEDALGQAEESSWAKEEAFPSEAADWAARHHTEVVRSILTTPEETIDFFKVMYQEPEGKRMITEIGSYGFQCGQKEDRSLLYTKL